MEPILEVVEETHAKSEQVEYFLGEIWNELSKIASSLNKIAGSLAQK